MIAGARPSQPFFKCGVTDLPSPLNRNPGIEYAHHIPLTPCPNEKTIAPGFTEI
jgi:hypothetical protein